MSNLSQQKRQRMLEFLPKIREEHKNDDNVLIALGEIENELNSKKYGLVWEQHEEAVDVKMKTHIPVFTEDKDREICTALGENYNFLLEGDNLHSLRLLQKTHKGKIDLIYIDPPYNTGNKDFIYDDKYVDAEDLFYHSKWISFMNKRIRQSYKLLKEEGLFCVQVNEIELFNLKLLCDEIYGENNFINLVSLKTKASSGASGGGEDKKLKKNIEYLIFYAKNIDKLKLIHPLNKTPLMDYINEKKENDISWSYTSVFTKFGNLKYEKSIEAGDKSEIKLYKVSDYEIKSIKQIMKEEGLSEKEVYFKYFDAIFTTENAQTSIRTRVKDAVEEDNSYYIARYVPKTGKNKNKLIDVGFIGCTKRLVSYLKNTCSVDNKNIYKIEKVGTLWDDISWSAISSEGGIPFPSGKKPISLLDRILKMIDMKNGIVLDFFAGSGSTGHAVLNLNTQESSNTFILCTNNQNNICSDITYLRIKNVIEGYGKNKPIKANLKYYKTDFVSKEEDLSQVLLNHIAEMIQLEHGIKLDGKQYIMILDDDEADQLASQWSEYTDVKALYVSRNVLFTTEQNALFKNINIHIIPDYYFNFELREAGESW